MVVRPRLVYAMLVTGKAQQWPLWWLIAGKAQTRRLWWLIDGEDVMDVPVVAFLPLHQTEERFCDHCQANTCVTVHVLAAAAEDLDYVTLEGCERCGRS